MDELVKTWYESNELFTILSLYMSKVIPRVYTGQVFRKDAQLCGIVYLDILVRQEEQRGVSHWWVDFPNFFHKIASVEIELILQSSPMH